MSFIHILQTKGMWYGIFSLKYLDDSQGNQMGQQFGQFLNMYTIAHTKFSDVWVKSVVRYYLEKQKKQETGVYAELSDDEKSYYLSAFDMVE